MVVDHLAGDHEGRRELVPVEERVDARQRRAHVVVAA